MDLVARDAAIAGGCGHFVARLSSAAGARTEANLRTGSLRAIASHG